jgi:hypothetical protein
MLTKELAELPMMVPLPTVNEVCGFKPSVAYKWIREQSYPMPLEQIGPRYYIRKVDLMRFIGLGGSDMVINPLDPTKTYRVSGKRMIKLQNEWWEMGFRAGSGALS